MNEIEIGNYIENQYRIYIKTNPEGSWDLQYEEFYQGIQHETLKKLLTVFHADLTTLFDTMNSRLPTGEHVAHFWAEESRQLILVIDCIRLLYRVLKDTKYAFSIDQYYLNLIDNCSQWISKSGGSTIPPNTEKVVLYHKKPIFFSVDNFPVNSELHALGEQKELLGRGGFGEVYRFCCKNIQSNVCF